MRQQALAPTALLTPGRPRSERIVMFMYSYSLCALFCIFCFHRANCHSPTTLTERFPCFCLRCKANARVYLAKTGHGPHSSKLCCSMYCLCRLCCSMYRSVCKCVLYYCHRVSTKFQLNIYHIIYRIVSYHIYHIISSHHITSHHITSHHITSHHITSHIISYHIISYHITCRWRCRESSCETAVLEKFMRCRPRIGFIVRELFWSTCWR
jgi:hypothetical protein